MIYLLGLFLSSLLKKQKFKNPKQTNQKSLHYSSLDTVAKYMINVTEMKMDPVKGNVIGRVVLLQAVSWEISDCRIRLQQRGE